MEHNAFKIHIEHIKTACQDYLGKDYNWFQALSNQPEALTLVHTYPISVRVSTYGKGLFADCDIPADTAITMYPAHYTVITTSDGKQTVTHPKGLPEPDKQYHIRTSSSLSFIGCPDLWEHPWFLGHMLNDSCNLEGLKKRNVAGWLLHYNRTARPTTNTRFIIHEDHIYVVTTRDVKKDEELFISYGPDYWFVSQGIPDWKHRIMRYIMSLPSDKRALLIALLQSENGVQSESLPRSNDSAGP